MKNIKFYLASDTLIHLSQKIILNLVNNANVEILIPKHFDENAEKAIKQLLPNIKYGFFNIKDFFTKKPDAIVFGNDWSSEAKIIIFLCRVYNITTYCIQESVVDFGDKANRLEYADYIFIQGEQTKEHLKRNNLILSGNPRYEDLKYSKITNNQILINCNFTYGIFEDQRDSWIDDIVSCCKKAKINFKISQHPRDTGDLSRYKEHLINSSASTIEKQLLDSSIIITRFSSVIHEAILLGRKVIYYNPHNEKMFYDFKPDNIVMFTANNIDSLNGAITNAKKTVIGQDDNIDYLRKHVRPFEEKPSLIISNFILKENNNSKSVQNINHSRSILAYIKIIILFYFKKLYK